jgi:GT2 family glycosyltransferase
MTAQDCTVAVIILNWNGGEDILDCLTSVLSSTHTALEVVIVDNGSVDGSTDVIRERFPAVHLICNSENLGFARGSNQGMEWAVERGIPYALLLNGDARLHPEAIGELLAAAYRDHDSVVTCPKMYLGEPEDKIKKLWFAYGTVKLWAGLFQNPAFNQIDSSFWSQERNMEYASGCCMLIPTYILGQTGMFDEAFFAYCEDVDLSLRIRRAGFRLLYVPTAHLWHGSRKPTKRTRTATHRYLSTRNNLWVVRKHGSWFDVMTYLGILPLRSLFRIAKMTADRNWGTFLAEARGILDGITTRPPPVSRHD